MVDLGFFDFGQFSILFQGDCKMIDCLLIASIQTVRLPQVIMSSYKSKFGFAMYEDHNFTDGLDVHSKS